MNLVKELFDLFSTGKNLLKSDGICHLYSKDKNKRYLILFTVFILFLSQGSFAMNSYEAKNIMLQHYNESNHQNFNPFKKFTAEKMKSYEKDSNLEINKKLIQNNIKAQNDYNIWATYTNGKIAYYTICYHKAPIEFSYDTNGNLIMISFGLFSDKNDYVYAYTYSYPSKELLFVTLYTESGTFKFVPRNGDLVTF